MIMFINVDKNKEMAIKTKNELISTCEELSIYITNNIDDADIICSIGGDGTFLESSRLSNESPVIGINCGTLGFLTDVNPSDTQKAMKCLLENNYYIEERMMLEGKIVKNDGTNLDIPKALNDICISKNTFGVVRFDMIIDGKLINSYTADGIIFSTPTGSTAYNLSCSGPIVDPNANIITITPIAPHTLLNHSIILSENSNIEIKITEIRENSSSYVLYDGNPIEIGKNDSIHILKSNKVTKVIKFN